MEYRMLEVTPVSAEDLKDVKLFGKMQTYVVAWVDPSRKASTNLDRQGGKNPRWNDKLLLTVTDQMLQNPKSMLVLEIYSTGFSNTIVGRVNVPLQEISGKSSDPVPFSYKIRRPSGRFQGLLHVSVKLGEKIQQPATTTSSSEAAYGYPYPAGQQPPQQAYPPRQQGYPPAQQQGYYPPAGQGYYPPAGGGMYAPQAQMTRPGRFGGGMGGGGMGMGLAGGLLGGLLIGDMLDNDHYGGGYGGDYGGGDYGGGGDFGGGDFGGGDF